MRLLMLLLLLLLDLVLVLEGLLLVLLAMLLLLLLLLLRAGTFSPNPILCLLIQPAHQALAKVPDVHAPAAPPHLLGSGGRYVSVCVCVCVCVCMYVCVHI